jgi:hypothetical protein
MKTLLFIFVLLFGSTAFAEGPYTYHGTWKTTAPRKLDGDMTAVITPLGGDKWSGRFHGIWQGVPFDYTVKFSGKYNALTGKANIDGANYDWKGSIADETWDLNGSYGGDRYAGSFALKLIKK